MDVDDDQDDPNKRQIMTSKGSKSYNKSNNYRCIDKGANDHPKTTLEETTPRKQRRKSRFSDRLPIEDNQSKQMESDVDDDIIFLKKTIRTSTKTITVSS